MPRRVPSDIEDRVDKMIQIWERIGPEKVLGDLSLQVIREKLNSRQRAKDHQLLTASADSIARTQLHVEDEEVYDMTVQTLQVTSFLYGSDSPEYKLAGGTPLSERGRNSHKPSDNTPASSDSPKP